MTCHHLDGETRFLTQNNGCALECCMVLLDKYDENGVCGGVLMKKAIRENIHVEYSLHDMNVIEFSVDGNDMLMRTQSGIVQTVPPYGQHDGYVEFHDIEWRYSYAYILYHNGNVGEFSGEKMMLQDFLHHYSDASFDIMDESYGHNQSKFSGFISKGKTVGECFIEIYHKGDMVFVDQEIDE